MNAVADGPNDQTLWGQACPKVMHLLKQPTKNNLPTKENPSLPALIQQLVQQKGIGKKFMYRVALRSYGLLNGFVPWEQAEKATDEALGKALLASAIVNLENMKLASDTPKGKVLEFAMDNRERWHGQIRTWKPQVIVCGGTFKPVWQAMQKIQKAPSSRSSTGMRYFSDPSVSGCVYLDAPHPTARYPLAMVYTYLMVSAKEILELNRPSANR